jgi:hypothetical protein
MKPLLLSLSLLTAAALLPAAAEAHHSGAMYDDAKTVTLTGPIKEFHWMNPHAVIEVMAPDAAGIDQVWNIECSTPNILVRGGWSIHSLKAGDMVSIQVHPMKSGGAAGIVLQVKTAAGAVLRDHGYQGAA